MNKSWLHRLMHKFISDYPHDDTQLTLDCLKYLIKVLTASELTASIREESNKCNVREFRKALSTDGYALKNLKLWLWWLASKRTLKKGDPSRLASRFDVKREDIGLADILFSDRESLKQLKLLTDTYKAHTLPFYERVFSQSLEEAKPYANSFSYRKMRFLTWANSHLDLMDIQQELLYNGLLGAQRQYPKVESQQHLVNIIKRCIHNHGINLIKYHTAKSRTHLNRNEDGTFSSTLVSRHASQTESGYLYTYNQMVDLSGQNSQKDIIYHNNDPKALSVLAVNRLGTHTNLGWALHIITGQLEDKDFTRFLGRNHQEFQQSLTNQNDVQDYMKSMGQYLGVKKGKIERFTHELKKSLKNVL